MGGKKKEEHAQTGMAMCGFDVMRGNGQRNGKSAAAKEHWGGKTIPTKHRLKR